jgi:hypothetical protein
MASLSLGIMNARREPLEDTADVDVTLVRANELKRRERGIDASKKLVIRGLDAGETFLVRVFPMRHRPVGVFAMAPGGQKPGEVTVYCPVHPQRVTDVKFPDFADLDPTLRNVLDSSTLERDPSTPPPVAARATPGQQLYEGLTSIERAGLLNLFAKMSHTPLGDATAWNSVTDLFRVRGDRIFADVLLEMRDRVKNAVAGGAFKSVDESLHTPPTGFDRAGSFKSRDPYGNLQLSFFSAVPPAALRFRVDADIDDAGGIGHAFQVLDHFLTGEETHPFDIHEILLFHQHLDPGYELVA